MAKSVQINRAAVLTLWAAVVAEQLGFQRDEALSLGKSVAGLNAQSKGRRLGIFEPSAESVEQKRKERGEEFKIGLLGRGVPARSTDDGVRAVTKSGPVTPDSVERYLGKKFGDALDDVRSAMEDLAGSFDSDELAEKAYDLYADFRPRIPSGKKGWGAKGTLDLETIRKLGKG
jgi:hypothetical protein